MGGVGVGLGVSPPGVTLRPWGVWGVRVGLYGRVGYMYILPPCNSTSRSSPQLSVEWSHPGTLAVMRRVRKQASCSHLQPSLILPFSINHAWSWDGVPEIVPPPLAPHLSSLQVTHVCSTRGLFDEAPWRSDHQKLQKTPLKTFILKSYLPLLFYRLRMSVYRNRVQCTLRLLHSEVYRVTFPVSGYLPICGCFSDHSGLHCIPDPPPRPLKRRNYWL